MPAAAACENSTRLMKLLSALMSFSVDMRVRIVDRNFGTEVSGSASSATMTSAIIRRGSRITGCDSCMITMPITNAIHDDRVRVSRSATSASAMPGNRLTPFPASMSSIPTRRNAAKGPGVLSVPNTRTRNGRGDPMLRRSALIIHAASHLGMRTN